MIVLRIITFTIENNHKHPLTIATLLLIDPTIADKKNESHPNYRKTRSKNVTK